MFYISFFQQPPGYGNTPVSGGYGPQMPPSQMGMGGMGVPPQYNQMQMPPQSGGIQPITSQRRPSTLQYQPNPQTQAPMPGQATTPSRYMSICDTPGMPTDTKPIIGIGGMAMKPSAPRRSPMVDVKPPIPTQSKYRGFLDSFTKRHKLIHNCWIPKCEEVLHCCQDRPTVKSIKIQ